MKDLKITDKNKLMDITMCNKLSEEDLPPKQCIIRECDACGVGKLINHLQALIDRATEKILTWQYWTPNTMRQERNNYYCYSIN